MWFWAFFTLPASCCKILFYYDHQKVQILGHGGKRKLVLFDLDTGVGYEKKTRQTTCLSSVTPPRTTLPVVWHIVYFRGLGP